ncbi:hypothetical protein Glove_469g31 [Diversispora epigaea]|uniref:Uncharacterized protein n=1 Tax=Diversispora epigaea TaxID=1348612 RepID=A0A397GLB6_9GLOM|nr:hypothetical protein Glove_469g31 [Diversispora epigaea]
MDDAKLFILQNYYIDEEAKELGFKQLGSNSGVVSSAKLNTMHPNTKENSRIPPLQNCESQNKRSYQDLKYTFQHEGGWITQIGDSETEKELLEADKHVINNVCAWIEKYDKEQKYLLAQFGDDKISEKITKKMTVHLMKSGKKNNKELIDCTDKYVVGNVTKFSRRKRKLLLLQSDLSQHP